MSGAGEDAAHAALDVMREVLDHEIVDVDGVTCGMVDDVVLRVGARGAAEIAFLLVGTDAWFGRLPAVLEVVLRWLVRPSVVRVPWEQVTDVSEVIRLGARAASLGLGSMDRKVGRWLAKVPMA